MIKQLIMSFAIWLSLASTSGAQTVFVPGFEDLPLAPGLSPSGDPVAFVTAAGRIIESTAELSAQSSDVLAFYSGTLPQLGWVKAAGETYVREGETLSVDIQTNTGTQTVVFRLTPNSAP